MRFLVDAQLPPALALWLREAGYDAQAVREVGLRDADDTVIWRHALAHGWVIVTKDEDFVQRAHTGAAGLGYASETPPMHRCAPGSSRNCLSWSA